MQQIYKVGKWHWSTGGSWKQPYGSWSEVARRGGNEELGAPRTPDACDA